MHATTDPVLMADLIRDESVTNEMVATWMGEELRQELLRRARVDGNLPEVRTLIKQFE